jgi:hypothetical protein
MAYTCQWPCVSDAVPSLSNMVQSAAPVHTTSAAAKSFAAALVGASASDDRPYPSPCIKGDTLSIKITQEEYRKGIEDCKYALRARLTLNKGEKPYLARDLSSKISKLWKTTASWKMVPLGKGYYDFLFDSAEDYRKIWAVGTVNLKPGLLRLSQWTKDFKYQTQKQTHVSLWIRLVELPQEYWRERTLKEIASAVGTPIDIDGHTRNRTFGHYARILVDIDLSKKLYDEILVEREDFAFKVEVQYERMPLFCHHCHSIGHNIASCRWLHPQLQKDKADRGKQIVVAESNPKHPIRQNKNKTDVGTSKGNNSWVPVPVASTVTTTHRVLDTATTALVPTSSVSGSLALPTSLPASTSFLGPIVSSMVATTTMTAPAPQPDTSVPTPVSSVPVSLPVVPVSSVPTPISTITQSIPVSLPAVPVSDFSSNSFSLPLHNVFDVIGRSSTDELALNMPVSEKIVSPVAHVDVHSVEVEKSHQASREVLENPTVTVATNPLLDSVKNNHVNHRELEESPIGSIESASHLSPLGREDVRPDGVEQTHQILREELEIPVIDDISEPLQDGVEHDHVSPRELEKSPKGARESVSRPSSVEHVDMHEVSAEHHKHPKDSIVAGLDAQPIDHNITNIHLSDDSLVDVDVTEICSQEGVPQYVVTNIHSSERIQHDIELWRRVKEYDKKSMEMPLVPALTRKQKQHLKKTTSGKPYTTRSTGDNSTSNQ